MKNSQVDRLLVERALQMKLLWSQDRSLAAKMLSVVEIVATELQIKATCSHEAKHGRGADPAAALRCKRAGIQHASTNTWS